MSKYTKITHFMNIVLEYYYTFKVHVLGSRGAEPKIFIWKSEERPIKLAFYSICICISFLSLYLFNNNDHKCVKSKWQIFISVSVGQQSGNKLVGASAEPQEAKVNTSAMLLLTCGVQDPLASSLISSARAHSRPWLFCNYSQLLEAALPHQQLRAWLFAFF